MKDNEAFPSPSLPNSLCRIIDLNDLPTVDASGGGGEVHADSEYPSAVVGERAGVAFLLDLREGFVRGGVEIGRASCRERV